MAWGVIQDRSWTVKLDGSHAWLYRSKTSGKVDFQRITRRWAADCIRALLTFAKAAMYRTKREALASVKGLVIVYFTQGV